MRILKAIESSSSQESSSSAEYLTIVAPTEAASSEGNSSSTQHVVSFGPINTALQLELNDLYQAPAHILGSGTYSLKCLSGPELVVKQRTHHQVGVILPKETGSLAMFLLTRGSGQPSPLLWRAVWHSSIHRDYRVFMATSSPPMFFSLASMMRVCQSMV